MDANRYGYAALTPAMEAKLAEVVGGQVVYDFGSGVGELAAWMARRKAKSVTAIDCKTAPKFRSKRVVGIRKEIKDVGLPDSIDVGVVAWPSNRPTKGLVEALHRCKTVVYLGCNDWSTACGSPDLFPYLMTRELLAYLPDRQNDLIIVGKPLPDGQVREPTPEEERGSASWDPSRIHDIEFWLQTVAFA